MLTGIELGNAIRIAVDLKKRSGAVKSAAEVARHFGIQPPSLSDWMNRGTIAKDKLPELWRYFSDVVGYDHWGMSESEWPFGLSAPTTPSLLSMDGYADFRGSEIAIPLLQNGCSMGGGVAMLESDMTIGAISVQQSWVAKNLPGITNVTNLRFVHAYGDSMIPTFADGDILLVDSGVKEPKVDGHYVLNVHDELYIKRVSRRFDGKHEITSDNPTVRTSETLNGDHQAEVKGRVVWVWNGKRL